MCDAAKTGLSGQCIVSPSHIGKGLGLFWDCFWRTGLGFFFLAPVACRSSWDRELNLSCRRYLCRSFGNAGSLTHCTGPESKTTSLLLQRYHQPIMPQLGLLNSSLIETIQREDNILCQKIYARILFLIYYKINP